MDCLTFARVLLHVKYNKVQQILVSLSYCNLFERCKFYIMNVMFLNYINLSLYSFYTTYENFEIKLIFVLSLSLFNIDHTLNSGSVILIIES